MKCEKCGKDIPKGFSFCLSCNNNPTISEQQIEKETKSINDASNTTNNNQGNSSSQTIIVKCRCGQILEPNWKFCPQCNKPITVEITSSNSKTGNNLDGTNYAIIAIISLGLSYFISALIPGGFWICYIISVISLVTGKIKFPNNIVLKVLFWLMVLHSVIIALFTIWVLVMCSTC